MTIPNTTYTVCIVFSNNKQQNTSFVTALQNDASDLTYWQDNIIYQCLSKPLQTTTGKMFSYISKLFSCSDAMVEVWLHLGTKTKMSVLSKIYNI